MRSFDVDAQRNHCGNVVYYFVDLIENGERIHRLYFKFYRKAVAAGGRWKNQRFVTEEQTLDSEYRQFLRDLYGLG